MLEDLKALSGRGGDRKKVAPKESWRPQLELDADGGYFVTEPRKAAEVPDQADLLAEFDLNPDEWIVVNVRRSKWQAFDGEWLQAYKVNLVPVKRRNELLDIGPLEDEIKKWRPKKESKQRGDLTAIYAVGDTQWGKDAGDGTAGTVDRMMLGLAESLIHHRTLKGIGHIAIPQMGDCIEGVVSQNGKIAGRLDLSLTQQIRVGRRVLLEWVKAFAPLTNDLVVPVVPGNHDESHRQLLTDPIDSWQVEIVQQVMDIAKENPALGHVTSRFPESDNSTLAVDFSGTMVGFAHGHQGRGGIENWWKAQALGRTPIGQADVLITAHYHHYKANQVGPNLWVQIPAMDGGSPWFRDNAGLESPPGIVSLVVGEGYDPRRNLTVLAGMSL
jgi:predicted phosphodiesterase